MPKSNRKIKGVYLDYAGATPIDPKVRALVRKMEEKNFANPGAIHALGVDSRRALEEARGRAARALRARAAEIFFTSGTTEANNLAIAGLIEGIGKPAHIITTNIEHPSVLEVCRTLEREKKARVSYVPVEPNGIVNPKKIKAAIRPDTVLVSVMYANNEIGTIQPIREVAKILRLHNKNSRRKIFFHTDAAQAVNYLPMTVDTLGADLISFGGGKIYGPKGVGGLYVKTGTALAPIIHGGDQETGLRAGTENLPAIAGLALALEVALLAQEKESAEIAKLREYFLRKLERSAVLKDAGIILNGDRENRLPNNVNITIPRIPSELLVLELSARGIYVSEKSACKSADSAPSHVIAALRGRDLESLRLSFGRSVAKSDLDYTVKVLETIFIKLKKWYH